MELERSSAIDRLQSRMISIEEFDFDRLSAPPLYSLLTPTDIDNLYKIATSVRYSGNPRKKYKAIDDIMKPRGFVKLSAGTNRVVYRFLENDSFVIKVAADAVGIKDNPREFMNQHLLKPFVTKVFEVSPCGTVGLFERVIPVTSREEYASIADDVYDLITNWIIGNYIMADIGTKFFMNIGIRRSVGPVLLDFPYLYELDGNKLFCSAPNDKNETGRCDGVIDYDDGFNFLVCKKCGVKYRVNELAKSIKDETIIVKGRRTKRMKVSATRYGVNVKPAEDNIDKMFAPETAKVQKKVESKPAGTLKVGGAMKEVSTKKNAKGKKNNQEKKSDYRKPTNNSGANRGMVKVNDTASSDLKVSVSKNNDTLVAKVDPSVSTIDKIPAVTIESVTSGEYNFREYDAEHKLLIFVNKEDERIVVAANISTIPEEHLMTYTGFESIKAELEADLEKTKNDLDVTENLLSKSQEAYNELYASYDKKSKDYEDLKKEMESVEEDVETVVHKCSCDTIKAENEKLLTEVAELESRNRQLQENLDIKVAEYNDYVESTNAQIASMEAAKSSAADSISDIEAKVAELTKLSDERSESIDILQSKLDETEKELDNALGVKKELEKTIKKLQKELENANKANKATALDSICESLSIANETLERSLILSSDYFDYKNNEEYLSNIEGVQVIYGNVVPMSSIIKKELERDFNIIVFPNGDTEEDGYSTDQVGNIIAVITVDDKEIEGYGKSVIPAGASSEEVLNSEAVNKKEE